MGYSVKFSEYTEASVAELSEKITAGITAIGPVVDKIASSDLPSCYAIAPSSACEQLAKQLAWFKSTLGVIATNIGNNTLTSAQDLGSVNRFLRNECVVGLPLEKALYALLQPYPFLQCDEFKDASYPMDGTPQTKIFNDILLA